ncbi:MAG TPA: PspC domain-containing protein [Candidatus Saccharimonadales bacterium]|nr:PspC domain-containing protein [Candidatus Saccharimonadales bacterium]
MPKTKKRPASKNSPKRLYLSNDKKLAGVCGGIAEYIDVDPTIIRLAFVFLTVVSGIVPGVLAYIIAAAIMPSRPGRS